MFAGWDKLSTLHERKMAQYKVSVIGTSEDNKMGSFNRQLEGEETARFLLGH